MQSKLSVFAIVAACLCARASAQTVLKIYTGQSGGRGSARAVLWTARPEQRRLPRRAVARAGLQQRARRTSARCSGKFMVYGHRCRGALDVLCHR